MTSPIQLLTEREAAELLCVSFRTLQVWRSKGKGPAYIKLGRTVRYDPADLRRWIDQSREETNDAQGE